VRPIGALYLLFPSFGAFFVSLVILINSFCSLHFTLVVINPSSFIYSLAKCHVVGSRKVEPLFVYGGDSRGVLVAVAGVAGRHGAGKVSGGGGGKC